MITTLKERGVNFANTAKTINLHGRKLLKAFRDTFPNSSIVSKEENDFETEAILYNDFAQVGVQIKKNGDIHLWQ